MWFGWNQFLSNTKLLSHHASINFFCWIPFLFFSFKLLYSSTQFLTFDLFEPCTVLNIVNFYLVSEFLFSFFFGCCECWYAVNAGKHEQGYVFTTKNNDSTKSCHWCKCWLTCIRLYLHHDCKVTYMPTYFSHCYFL